MNGPAESQRTAVGTPCGIGMAVRSPSGASPRQTCRLVLATAALESTVSHARAMTLCDMHPADMTRLLQRLVQDDFLEKVGQGRGTKYHLPGAPLADPDEAFVRSAPLLAPPEPSEVGSQPSELGFEATESRSEGSATAGTGGMGRIVPGLSMHLIDNIADLTTDLRAELQTMAAPANAARVPREEMEAVIVALCSGRYVTLRTLAALLGRADVYLRQNFLNPLVRQEKVKLAFPHKPNDPRQAYSSATPRSDNLQELGNVFPDA